MSQIIITNLRMEEPDWLQIKAMAGEVGMSVNKYINCLIRKVTTKQQLGIVEDTQKATIWNLPHLAQEKNVPSELNEDDAIIYA